MLDRLMVKRSIRKDAFTDAFTERDAILVSDVLNPEGRKLSVLFPPWHGGGIFYERMISRLLSIGDAVLPYYLHDEILKPDAYQVQRTFAHMRDEIVAQLSDVTAQHEYEKIHLIGQSLGNPLMSMVTSRFPGFDSITFITNSSSLARSAWHGIRTPHVRAGIEAQHIDLPDLETLWREMSPLNHLSALVGKDIEILMSTTDQIIPTQFQQEFVDGVYDAGLQPVVSHTSLGHYGAIGRYCVLGY